MAQEASCVCLGCTGSLEALWRSQGRLESVTTCVVLGEETVHPEEGLVGETSDLLLGERGFLDLTYRLCG
jgi:hypothetical protein